MINLLLIALITTLDQLSKWWAQEVLSKLDTIPIIKDVFHLTYARNTGAAFSLFNKHTSVLTITTLFIVAGMLIYLYKFENGYKVGWTQMSIVFIIGGAVGNLIDRARLGYVVDYFDFRLIDFAIFNVADSFVVVGTIIYAIMLLFFDDKK